MLGTKGLKEVLLAEDRDNTGDPQPATATSLRTVSHKSSAKSGHIRLFVGARHWLDRIVVLVAWMVLDACLRGGVPLPRLSSVCGVALSDADGTDRVSPVILLSELESRRLRMANHFAGRWRFGSGPCLRQALVSGWILRRHGPRLCLGVSPVPSAAGAGASSRPAAIQAHAWIELPDGSRIGYRPGYSALTQG